MKRRNEDEPARAGAGTMLAMIAGAVLVIGVLLAGCIGMAFVLWLIMGGPLDLSALAE